MEYSNFGEVVIYNKNEDITFNDENGDAKIFKNSTQAKDYLFLLGFGNEFIENNIIFSPVNYEINPSNN